MHSDQLKHITSVWSVSEAMVELESKGMNNIRITEIGESWSWFLVFVVVVA